MVNQSLWEAIKPLPSKGVIKEEEEKGGEGGVMEYKN